MADEPKQVDEIKWRHRVGLLAERLRKAVPGELVPYEEMQAVTGITDHEMLLAVWRSAQRRVLHDSGMDFRAVEKRGVYRLTDAEIATERGAEQRAKVRRGAGRLLKRLACVKDFKALTPEQRLEWNVSASVAALTQQALAPATIKKVAASASSSEQQELGVRAILDMLTAPRHDTTRHDATGRDEARRDRTRPDQT